MNINAVKDAMPAERRYPCEQGECAPYYDSVNGTWRLFTDREEEGDALYIASELIRDGVIYPFHSEQPKKEKHHNHEHDFVSVVEFLLGKPDYFSIEGFEEYYSSQERKMLAELQRKFDIPGSGE